MAQIARLLAVATVFIGLWTRNNWGLICETKLSMQELELKMQGGGGGVTAGFYDTMD